jgi:DNA-binding response OmpR family regulator
MQRILVVDDDRQLCDQIVWSLKEEYAISRAGDCGEALALLERENPDLLLLDLHLPPARGANGGMSILKEVRTRGLDAAVIVMTGRSR